MKMKKVIIVGLSSLFTMSMVNQVGASSIEKNNNIIVNDTIINDIIIDDSIIDMNKIDSLERKSSVEMTAIFNEIASDYDENIYPLISKSKSVKTLENNQISTLSLIDANTVKLRTGNIIEVSLNQEEGMSNTQINKTIAHGVSAKLWSSSTYPNNAEHEDAARHFAWNHISTSDSGVGKIKTKIATTNHEWGLVLITPALNYYETRYNYHVSKNTTNPTGNALNDTLNYLPYLKSQLILLADNSFSTFKSIFTPDNIMDFNNNCYGRVYPELYPSQTVYQTFNKAITNNEIILSKNNVNDSAYYKVWNNGWYK